MPAVAIPTIEVFIFCFNHEKFLAKAVQSVLSQEGSFRLSITIVDDNSSDNSVELLRHISEQNENVTLFLHKRNRFKDNPSYFFDYLKSSQADFVATLAADDYWMDATKIQKQMVELEKHSHASIVFHDFAIDINNIAFSIPNFRSPKSRVIYSIHKKNIVGGMTVLMRPQLALAGLESFMNHDVLEDYVMWANAIRNGPAIYLSDKLAAYRVHSDNRWALKSSFKKIQDLEATQRYIAKVVFAGKSSEWNSVVRRIPALKTVRLLGMLFQVLLISLLKLFSQSMTNKEALHG